MQAADPIELPDAQGLVSPTAPESGTMRRDSQADPVPMKETVREEAVSFGAWVRKRRRALDLTQARLGELSACAESTVRKIEADERRPSRRTAERLARVLRIPETERLRFVEAARGEQRTDRLDDPSMTPAPQAVGTGSVPAGDLIGREAEVALIERRLADPGCRLLTITGPGGIGKTRLAFAAAERSARLFPDSAWIVNLAAADSRDVLLSAIVQALAVTPSSEADTHTQLKVYLRERCLLLVLDNFEQLLPATQTVAGLLDAAPRIKLLITSRERLNLSDEWLLPLQGLTVATRDGEGIASSAAMRLFRERATRVQPGFPRGDEELAHAARICALVEGTPLAIELAAAWTHLLPCAEILREIERNVDFLRSNARDVPARHASLRAAFDHSLALLTDEERRAFARMSAFRGAFERRAASIVADADLPRLAALADKSLLRHGGDGQLAMHELLRQFAAELLARDASEEARVRAAHGRYFLEMIIKEHSALVGASAGQAAARIEPLLPDLRAAIHWALSQHEFALIAEAVVSLYWVYELSSRFGEAIELFQTIRTRAASSGGDPSEPRMWLVGMTHGLLSWLLLQTGRYAESLQNARIAVVQLRSQEPVLELPLCLATLAIGAAYAGEREEAQRALDEMHATPLPEGRPGWLGQLQLAAALAYSALGNVAAAERELQLALAALKPLGQPWMLGSAYFYLGNVALRRGHLAEARQYAERSVATWRALGERHPALVLGEATLGRVALKSGDFAIARTHFQRSLERSKLLGYAPYIAHAQANLGRIEAAEGRYDVALRYHEEALQVNRELGNHLGTVRSLVHCARALQQLDEPVRAYASWREAALLALDAGRSEQAREAVDAMASLTRAPRTAGVNDPAQLRECIATLPAALVRNAAVVMKSGRQR